MKHNSSFPFYYVLFFVHLRMTISHLEGNKITTPSFIYLFQRHS
jgi:hypothetical protein